MGYNSALKKEEILTPAVRWMDLENIMHSEISQSQKDRGSVIPLLLSSLESQMVGTRGWRRAMRSEFNGDRVQFHKVREEFCGWMDSGDGFTQGLTVSFEMVKSEFSVMCTLPQLKLKEKKKAGVAIFISEKNRCQRNKL